jgi:hypothetical protein
MCRGNPMLQSHPMNRDTAMSRQIHEILSESVKSFGESLIQKRGDGDSYSIVRHLQQSASQPLFPKFAKFCLDQ